MSCQVTQIKVGIVSYLCICSVSAGHLRGHHSQWFSSKESETWDRILGWEDPLEEGMATHSSILAWRIRDRGAWWAAVHGFSE